MLKESISVGILCGGQGSRMGGVDKGLIDVHDKPLIEHCLERVGDGYAEVLINANRSHSVYKKYGKRVVSDNFEGFKGPLAGIEALLANIKTDWLATIPCDTPNFPIDIIQRLSNEEDSILIRTAHDGNYRQSVFSVIHVSVLADLRAFLERGEGKIDRFFAEVGFIDVDFSQSPEAFYNLNRPEEIESLP